jgi:hypothetical protein
MTRDRLAALLGVAAALAAAVLLLVGSDLPTTSGVAWAILAALGLGLVTGLSIRTMLRRDAAPSSGVALLIPAIGLALYLVLVAVVLMVLNPGEASAATPGVVDRLVLGFVAACVGWLAGAAVGGLALAADRYRDRPGRAYLLAVGAPAIVIVLLLVLRLAAAG